MATFKLNVEIAPNQLTMLKKGKYQLCIAKQLNGVYTVVWSCSTNYLSLQTFEWVEDYQVFGEQTFEIGALCQANTNSADIEFGQTSVLTEAGVMENGKGTPDKSGAFSVKNEFGLICIGVSGKIGRDFMPFFVSPTAVTGIGRFEPFNCLKVWFSLTQKPKAMIFDWDNEGIEVTYTGSTTEKSISYAGPDGHGQWSIL